MLAKLLGKPKTQTATPKGDWLDSPEGQEWEALSEVVYNALEGAKVNVHKRRIIMNGGAKLTINQAAREIADKTGNDVDAVREHVMHWLEEVGDSDDDERDDGVDVDYLIWRWVDDARRSSQPTS